MIFFVAVLDYYVKLIISSMPLFTKIPVIGNFFTITYVRNFGGAFSILQHQKLLFISVGIIVPIILFFAMRKKILTDFRYLFTCGAVAGGAVGNLIDRLAYGYVVDYISVGTFPVFNISDSFITVGVILLAYFVFIDEMKEEKKKKEEKAAEDA